MHKFALHAIVSLQKNSPEWTWGPPWHCQAPLGHPSCWQPAESLLSTPPYVLPTPCNSISITQWKNSFCAKMLRFFQTITLSRTPPTGSTRPCKEISPVIAWIIGKVIAWIIVKGNGFRFWVIKHAVHKSKASGFEKANAYYLEKAKLTRSVRTSRPVRRLTKVVAIVIPALGPSFIKIEVLYNGDFSLNRCTPNRSHLTSFMNNPKSENLCVVKLFK